MWEEMLLTEQLNIHMDKANHMLELKLRDHEQEDTFSTVQLSHAELILLLHTLLEVNRCFRGDIPYFHN
ncbi:hypothetical protein P5G65_15045 [Paenibacillus chondroitinus]|uniref:Uncharacterized protein n=1 Tax=Paenibacillus chondroitinus TaxID=59842 RepID=A0ABU6DBU4_9BACL|nr:MULTISPECIES: hypothetical protein [Paenibacillus]MCY9656397.1 hypothetical protein [Paenibacillus anseongense]MEB4795221.1 hypothetical protein [Paenibacillus chondroitinus]